MNDIVKIDREILERAERVIRREGGSCPLADELQQALASAEQPAEKDQALADQYRKDAEQFVYHPLYDEQPPEGDVGRDDLVDVAERVMKRWGTRSYRERTDGEDVAVMLAQGVLATTPPQEGK